jgi:hypothetical protein
MYWRSRFGIDEPVRQVVSMYWRSRFGVDEPVR